MTMKETTATTTENKKGATDYELQCQIVDLVEYYTAMAERMIVDVYLPRIESRFDLKGKAAGQYVIHGGSSYYRFHLGFAREHRDEYMDNTVPHEVAHYVADRIDMARGRKSAPHGSTWKSVMVSFGKVPGRCHQYDTAKVVAPTNRRKFKYACVCGTTYSLGIKAHKNSVEGSKYRCRQCKGPLKFVEQTAGERTILVSVNM